jgi:hypothetical protein
LGSQLQSALEGSLSQIHWLARIQGLVSDQAPPERGCFFTKTAMTSAPFTP